MSNEPGSGAAARDASIARVRNLTRGAVVCAAALSGAVAGLAVTSTHARKTAHPLTRAAQQVPDGGAGGGACAAAKLGGGSGARGAHAGAVSISRAAGRFLGRFLDGGGVG